MKPCVKLREHNLSNMRTFLQEGRVEHMSSLTISDRRWWMPGLVLLYGALALAPLQATAADTFERTLTVSGPIRLELNNGSGNVDIRGSADGKVHIVGKVTPGWSVF